jgi:branched-subunit amino acid transport protein
MEILPYTLMAALVFPAALSSVEGSWLASVASLAAAIILAIAKKPLMACVLAAVGVCALILLFV